MMARFFFHIRDGATFVPDEVGRDLPDLEGVKTEAAHSARELREQVDLFVSETPRIEVHDHAGNLIMIMPVYVQH